jgi:PIN domain nuclease of toxin-antitoxin system
LRLLLDTHALLWWFSDDPNLPKSCRSTISQQENEIFVSAASAWEVSTKFRLGKLPSASELVHDFRGYVFRAGFYELNISSEHGIRAGHLPGPLKDPFDRMLVAQSQCEGMSIVSNEAIFEHYGIDRVW